MSQGERKQRAEMEEIRDLDNIEAVAGRRQRHVHQEKKGALAARHRYPADREIRLGEAGRIVVASIHMIDLQRANVFWKKASIDWFGYGIPEAMLGG